MKLVVSLTISLLLVSCSSRFDVLKQRYNRGYYVAVNKKQGHPKVSHKTPLPGKSEQVVEIPVVSVVSGKIESEKCQPSGQFESAPVENIQTQANSILQVKKDFASPQKRTPTVDPKRSSTYSPARITKQHTARSNFAEDIRDTVALFFCLFPILCLLGIFIHDNKKLTWNLWASLALHPLLIVGATLSNAASLIAYLLVIGFAILVICDVINFE